MAYSGWGCFDRCCFCLRLDPAENLSETGCTAVRKKEDSAIDYDAYVGTWFSKEISSADEFYESGGSAVQIFSIDDRIAEISLSTVQSAPANRAATTDKIYGEVDGNVIQFSFSK